jgi:PPOX class probable F420-dependent enzyme
VAHELENAKYISFGTFRDDGSIARTPVWVVPFEDGYAFSTEGHSFKVRRLKKNPRCEVASSNFRGVVLPGASNFVGTAEIVTGERSADIEKLLSRKYFFAWWFMIVPNEWLSKVRGKNPQSVAIKVTLNQ